MMSMPVRVLIVDDQPRARQSLRALLDTCPQFRPVGEAQNGVEALQAMTDVRPDVVLMDAHMPVMDGVETTRLIKTRWHHTKVIVLSMYTGDYAADAMAAGADAFLSKGAPPAELIQILTEIARPSNGHPSHSNGRALLAE